MTSSVRLCLEVQRVIDAVNIPTNADLYRWATVALTGQQSEIEIVIRIVDEAESSALNSGYRHRNEPTNVLSFPFIVPPPAQSSLLGDLVICAPLVAQEAKEQGKELSAHWAHLVIHGVLHLLGYDHMCETEAHIMENLERRMLAELGYPDPYTENEVLTS